MPLKLKIIWWCIVAGIGVAGFFGVAWFQSSAAATNAWLEGEVWIVNHAANPGLVIVAIILLLSTVIGSEVWWFIRRHLEAMEIKGLRATEVPQMPLQELAVYLRDEFIWGWREYWKFNFWEQVGHHVPIEICRQALAHEIRIVGAWGQPVITTEIDPNYWRRARIDDHGLFDPKWRRGSLPDDPSVEAFYEHLTVPRVDVARCWPRASVVRKAVIAAAMWLKWRWYALKENILKLLGSKDVIDVKWKEK